MSQSRRSLFILSTIRNCALFIEIAFCSAFSVGLMAQEIPNDFGPTVVKAKIAYLPPEHFTPKEEFLAFREHAHEFLRDHPDHVMAPRALHDLILIHSLSAKPDANVSNTLKARLAFEYPESLATTFMLKSFKDQSEFRQLLIAEFRKPDRVYSREFCRQFLKAAELGLNAFGPAFVGDDSFQFQIRLALSEGKSFRLTQLNEAHVALLKQPAKTGFEICRRADLDTPSRVIGLHQTIQSATPAQQNRLPGIRDAERFWMSRLTVDDRQRPRIMAILIEQKLELKKFDEALPELNCLLVLEQEPKWLFWRAWCLANVDQIQEAILAFEALQKQFPADPWARHGMALATVLRDREQALAEQVTAILDLVTDLVAENLEQLQVNAHYQPTLGKPFDLIANADSIKKTLDVFVQHGGLPLVGYKASLQDYFIFLKDQPEIHQIPKPGSFPELKLGLALTPQGPNANFHFNMYSTPEAAQSWRQAILDLLKNPLLANRESVQSLLKLNASGNGFPLRVTTEGDRRSLVWVTPQVNQPEMQRFEVELNSGNGHEFSLRMAESSAHIKFGKSGTVPAPPSPWDRLPVVRKNDLDAAMIMRAMSLAALIFYPDESQTESSGDAKPAN